MKANTLIFTVMSLLLMQCSSARKNSDENIPVKSNSSRVLVSGFAHNDYQNERPLLSAIEQGFAAVEVDIHYIDGAFYVCHDLPDSIAGLKTLEELYLNPLKSIVNSNHGVVYPGYSDFFYLMIDVKTEASKSYRALVSVLKQYSSIISVVTDTLDQEVKPVKVFISGHEGRPIKELLNDSIKYAGLDGRPSELKDHIPLAYMPVISDHYENFLSWKGEGEVNMQELNHLKEVINEAHRQGKKIRLWAAPDFPEAWELLLTVGVDFINTDRILVYKDFSKQR